MKKITKKILSTCTKDELLHFVSEIDRLDVNKRMLLLDELENRNETDILDEINVKLNSQELKTSASFSQKNKGNLLDYYHQLFDKKISKDKIYGLISKRYGIEDFEIEKIVSKEIKRGKREYLIGIGLIFVGAFRIFAAAYSDKQSSGLGFIIGFGLLAGGIYSFFTGRAKSRLDKE